jgi:hypothetical protein
LLATAAGRLPFGVSGRRYQRLDETTQEYLKRPDRLRALLISRVLTCLYSARFSWVTVHYPLSLGVIRFSGFPEIHTRAWYFKELVYIEDPLDIFGRRHVNDPEAERMAPLIPHNLGEHYRSKRGEGLTELVIGAKIG